MCPTRPVGGIFVNWNDVDNTCPLFSLVGQEHNAKVVDVYDGDSIKIVIKLSGTFQKFNCRLADIDTPELRSKNMNEKLYAHYVKKKVENDLLNKNGPSSYGEVATNAIANDLALLSITPHITYSLVIGFHLTFGLSIEKGPSLP